MAIPSIAMIPSGYKASKLYSVLPTDGGGDLDVVRATTATRVNSDGLIENVLSNVPRLDYTNGGCPSLLVEPQRTNLLLRSEEFENAVWGKSNVTVTANQSVSPKGDLTMDLIQANASLSVEKSITQTGIATTAVNRTISFFVKNVDANFIKIKNSGDTQGYVNFDINTGVVGLSGSKVTGEIIDYGNNIYRIIAVFDSSMFYGATYFITFQDNVNAGFSTTTSNLGGFYLWGAQLEQGSNATSYIPTVASTVTRNADVISKTGISDLINSNIKGAMFFHFSNNIPLITAFGAGVFNTNTGTGVFFRIDSGNIRVDVLNEFSTLFTYTSLININNSKLAVKWDNGVIKIFINGILRATSGSISIPSTNSFALSSNIGFTPALSLTYNSSKIYNTEISDTQLITDTTL